MPCTTSWTACRWRSANCTNPSPPAGSRATRREYCVPMPAGLIDTYPFAPDRYDEMLAGPGAPRPHWDAFARRLEGLPSQALRQRADFVADAIAADGVTYNVYADPEGMRR